MSVETSSLNGNIDWSSTGAVTSAKNEGQCRAGYAFSAVGAVEGVYWIQNRNLVEFSAQQIVDCSGTFGNNGCNGGDIINSYSYMSNRGIC